MVKISNQAVHTVMTIQACRSKSLYMGYHVTGIGLTMTGVADLQIKFGNVVRVAIGTDERFTRDFELVAV